MARPQPSINQLRPVLARALELARAAPPNRPLPGPVRGLVRARRLPASWEATMRRALEEDEAYRKWVAEEADQADTGRLAWLWIARPDGWSEELSGLIDAEEADREVHVLADRVAVLETELAAARAELAAMAQAMTGQATELEERDRVLAQAEARRQAAEDEAAAATARPDRAVGLERELSAVEARNERLAEDAAGLQQERARSEERAVLAEARADAAEARADAAEARAGQIEADERARAGRASEQRASADRIRSSVGDAVQRASTAASELGAALAAAAAALSPPSDGDPPLGSDRSVHRSPDWTLDRPAGPGTEKTVGAGSRPPARSGSTPAGPAQRPPRKEEGAAGGSRYRPVGLPPAVLADSPEAAAHLVRLPGIHLIVDGYNVALRSWAEPGPGGRPVADLPGLRTRLLDALTELVVRTKTDVTVVFDGRDQGNRVSSSGPAQPWLRILFSASSVEADEVILAEVSRLRPAGPVAVATDDREVREGAARWGANVMSVEQLMAVLNRHTVLGSSPPWTP